MFRVLKVARARLCKERAVISDWSFDKDITIDIQRKKTVSVDKNCERSSLKFFVCFYFKFCDYGDSSNH